MNETQLRQKMVKEGKKQGIFIRSVNDRFSSGRPDLRVSCIGTPPMDMELKICNVGEETLRLGKTIRSGITKLQAIEMRDMNTARMPAVGVVYFPRMDWFSFTNYTEFDPKQALATFSVEANKGKPNFQLLTSRAMMYLMQQGYRYE